LAAEVEARQNPPESGKSGGRGRHEESSFPSNSEQDRHIKITDEHFRHEGGIGVKR
jgi:hypothetical protein